MNNRNSPLDNEARVFPMHPVFHNTECKIELPISDRCIMHNHLEEQVNKLANFIMYEVPGEPRENENAVDCAIRIIKRQQALLQNKFYHMHDIIVPEASKLDKKC
jgi:hypothetical protein